MHAYSNSWPHHSCYDMTCCVWPGAHSLTWLLLRVLVMFGPCVMLMFYRLLCTSIYAVRWCSGMLLGPIKGVWDRRFLISAVSNSETSYTCSGVTDAMNFGHSSSLVLAAFLGWFKVQRLLTHLEVAVAFLFMAMCQFWCCRGKDCRCSVPIHMQSSWRNFFLLSLVASTSVDCMLRSELYIVCSVWQTRVLVLVWGTCSCLQSNISITFVSLCGYALFARRLHPCDYIM